MTPGRPIDLPPGWEEDLAQAAWARQTIGCSEAEVFRLEAPGRATLFVKVEDSGPFSELAGEGRRLRWLAARGIACPPILAEAHHAGRDWLLLGAVPGRDLASSPDLSPDRIVALYVEALHSLHRLERADCPFDHRLEVRLEQARLRTHAGLVDEEDFDEERRGRTAEELLAELVARRPSGEDLVVTHGDACLPNLIADEGRFTGFVDCGRMGVADRHQDLALAVRSIAHDVGEAWAGEFLRRYGGSIDPDRLAWYCLLDELF